MKFMLPSSNARVLFQGITHSTAAVHVEKAIIHGTNIVGGVSHEKGVKDFLGVPVFQTVKTAVKNTKPTICVVFSSPSRVYDDVKEVAKEKIPLIICTTEHVALHDALRLRQLAEKYKVCILGPASSGVVVPESCVAGTMPAHLFKKGNVAILARSSSLAYEAVQKLAAIDRGISACIALGTNGILCCSFVPVLTALASDKKTSEILVIGEGEGPFEFELAEAYRALKKKKKLIVYLVGGTLTDGPALHLIGKENKTPAEWVDLKEKALQKAGAVVIRDLDKLNDLMEK